MTFQKTNNNKKIVKKKVKKKKTNKDRKSTNKIFMSYPFGSSKKMKKNK